MYKQRDLLRRSKNVIIANYFDKIDTRENGYVEKLSTFINNIISTNFRNLKQIFSKYFKGYITIN